MGLNQYSSALSAAAVVVSLLMGGCALWDQLMTGIPPGPYVSSGFAGVGFSVEFPAARHDWQRSVKKLSRSGEPGIAFAHAGSSEDREFSCIVFEYATQDSRDLPEALEAVMRALEKKLRRLDVQPSTRFGHPAFEYTKVADNHEGEGFIFGMNRGDARLLFQVEAAYGPGLRKKHEENTRACLTTFKLK